MPLPPWTPDLSTLDLLLSVAELGSVGRAAAAHGISQPSASARLAHLERRLGVELLTRTPRGSRLTPSGEAVVAWARAVVAAAGELADGVRTLRADQRARLRVAASLTVAEYLMPQWLLVLRRRHPELEIAVSVHNSSGVIEAVTAGAADVGFVEMPTLPPGATAVRVGDDRLALVVAAAYPLAARARSGIRPGDLLDQPLLLREPGSGTRDTFLAALRAAVGEAVGEATGERADSGLPHALELGSTTTIVATARAGGGIGVVSARAVEAEIAAGTLVELTVRGLELSRPLHALTPGARPTPFAAELIALARAG